MARTSRHSIWKKFLIILTTAFLLCAGATSALAVSGDDVIGVTVNNCTADNDYLLMLVKSGTAASSISESNLLFVDQITASGSTIRAAVVYPNFSSCDVFAAGTFSDGAASPRKIAGYHSARIPEETVRIEDAAFENVAFTHIYLSDRTTAIGARAFAACDELVYIYIPASVTEIADSAFTGSTHVTVACPAGSKAEQFAKSKGLPTITVNR